MPTRPRQIPGTGGGANRLNQVRQMAAQRLQQRPPVAGDSGIKPGQGGMPPSITPAPISETIPRFPGLFAGEHSGLPTNAPLENGTGLPGGTYAPGQMLPGGGNPGINVQAPGVDPTYAAIVASLNAQGIQASTDPHTGEVGWAQYAPGLSVYEPNMHVSNAPGAASIPQNVQSDLASLTDPYLGDTYKQQAASDLGVANYDTLKQAILGTQAGQPLNPANPNNASTGIAANTPAAPPVATLPGTPPITSPVVQPVSTSNASASVNASPATLGPTSQQTNPQQFMNQGVPGHIDTNQEHQSGGQNNLGAAVQLAMQRNTGVSQPINPTMPGAAQPKAPGNGMLPFGGLQRLGNFAGAAGRLVGRV